MVTYQYNIFMNIPGGGGGVDKGDILPDYAK